MNENEKTKALQTENSIVCIAFYVLWAAVAFQGIKLTFSGAAFAFVSILLFAAIATLWESVAVFIVRRPRSTKDAADVAGFLSALVSLAAVNSLLTWGMSLLMIAVNYSAINSMELASTAFWSGWLVGLSKGNLQRYEFIRAAKTLHKEQRQ